MKDLIELDSRLALLERDAKEHQNAHQQLLGKLSSLDAEVSAAKEELMNEVSTQRRLEEKVDDSSLMINSPQIFNDHYSADFGGSSPSAFSRT